MREPRTLGGAGAARLARFAGGLLLVGFGVFIAGGVVAVRPAASRFDPGPTVFPLLVAILLIGLGLVELWFQARRAGDPEEEGLEAGSDIGVLRLLGALAVFLVIFSQFGILIGLAALVAFTCHEFGGGWKLSAALAIAVPAAEFVLFELVLGVRLTGF